MEMIPCGGFGLGNGLSVEKDEFGRPMLKGTDIFTVHMKLYGGEVTIDKSYDEILEALNNKQIGIATDGNYIYDVKKGYNKITFNYYDFNIMPSNITLMHSQYTYTPEGTITFTPETANVAKQS